MFEEYIQERPLVHFIFQLVVALVAAICIGVGLNFFLIPGDIFSSGTSGVAQIINFFADQIPYIGSFLTVGNLFFILNVPIIILSWMKLGRRFTLLTIVVVVLSTFATNLIPVLEITDNPLMNAIMGGVICGIGSGITIKFGMSCGGLDVVSLVLARINGSNVGALGFALNLLIILASGVLFDWEYALYTLISIYVLAKAIDGIHTSEQRHTAFIVTSQTDEVINAIFKAIVRGVTILEGQGGYRRDKRDVLMVVINRYEMYALQQAVKSVDELAFINFMPSTRVVGHFFSRDQQKAMKKQIKVVTDQEPIQDQPDKDQALWSGPMDFDQLYEQLTDED